MFLHLLSRDQQQLFCRAVGHVVRSDRVLHELEQEIQQSILRELRMDSFPADDESVGALLNDLEVLNSAVARRVFLVELVGVATADREFPPEEEDLLRCLASNLDVSDAELDQFVQFAYTAHELHDRGRILIHPHR